MDIFRFMNPTAASKMERGRLIKNLKSVMWVERYREAGEFTIVADVSSDVRSELPIGSYISHVESDQIMIVEDHQIADDQESDPVVSITGRSWETFLDQRVAGSDLASVTEEYMSGAVETWDQAVFLIRNHIYASELSDDDNAIPYFEVFSDVYGTGIAEARAIRRGSLYEAVLDILQVDDLGIKTLRPMRTTDLATAPENSVIVVHAGIDLTEQVRFSQSARDIESADYLWSNRRRKNCAFVTGKWVQTLVDSSATGMNRRMMHVDASDIDQNFTEAPTGPALANVIAAMQTRGKQALAAMRTITLSKAEISKSSQSPKYRYDYNIGDLVSVEGGYNTSRVYRVTEHVEIDDQDGAQAYPSLTALEEEE